MNQISETLLQAFDVAMDEKISKLRYDKSIQAIIKSIENAAECKYKVEYSGGIFDAYADDASKSYKVGESVWVTIPEGDFSNKKLIRGKVTNSSSDAAQYSQLQNSIFEVSPNFTELGYIYNASEFGLSINNSNNYSSAAVGGAGSTDFAARFAAYADQYEYIRVSASFKTEFIENHSRGDYGLKLLFKNISNENVEYYLNLSDFNGSLYALTTWSPQFTILRIPKGQIANLSSIVFYEQDFDHHDQEYALPTKNVFVKDISLNFVEVKDLTQQPYYLNILPQNGVLFTSLIQSLSLVGQLYYYGNKLDDNCIYQWYQQDMSVILGAEDYDNRAGWGWKAIPNATSKSYIVIAADVPWQATYKLVVVYNEETLMEREVTVMNANSTITVTIQQENTLNNVILKLSDSTKSGAWSYVSSDGNLHLLTSGNSIDVTNYLVYSPITFYCQIDNIGVLSYVMRNFESEDDVSVVFAGENLFTYDANGDISIYDADSEKKLEVTTIWNNGVISSDCVVDWLDGEGNILELNVVYDYSSRASMFKQVRIVEDPVDTTRKILYYKIKHKFKLYSELNNSFRIRITPRGQEPIFFTKQIYFTKIGDPGTNGTRYQTLITAATPLLVESGNLQLTCKVYKDSTEYTEGTKTIRWELVNLLTQDDLSVVSNSESIYVKISGTNHERYVKVTATIQDTTGITTLYDFFPVATAASNASVDLSTLPKRVQYGSNGLNPQYIRSAVSEMPFTINNMSHVSVINDYLKFPDSFDAANHVATLELAAAGITIYWPIVMYMNTFGNEAINTWDGVSINIDNDSHVILAPQIGAGEKDSSTNKFTGVVMGKDSVQQQIGLYGYSAGVNTFGLMKNGKAYFGAKSGGGQIVIDGTSAAITGGDSTATSAADNGMIITLADKSVNGTTKAIRIGKDKFTVNYNGAMTATSGSIAGWSLTTRTKDGSTISTLKAGNTYLDSDGYIKIGSRFSVDSSGNLIATNASLTSASVSGSITTNDLTATGGTIDYCTIGSGTIGGWTINSTSLSNGVVSLNSATGTITGAILSGGTAKIGKYYNIGGTAHLEVGNASYGDFSFYDGYNSTPIFEIYDNLGTVTFKAYGHEFLSYSNSLQKAFALGEWNISNVAVFA